MYAIRVKATSRDPKGGWVLLRKGFKGLEPSPSEWYALEKLQSASIFATRDEAMKLVLLAAVAHPEWIGRMVVRRCKKVHVPMGPRSFDVLVAQ